MAAYDETLYVSGLTPLKLYEIRDAEMSWDPTEMSWNPAKEMPKCHEIILKSHEILSEMPKCHDILLKKCWNVMKSCWNIMQSCQRDVEMSWNPAENKIVHSFNIRAVKREAKSKKYRKI